MTHTMQLVIQNFNQLKKFKYQMWGLKLKQKGSLEEGNKDEHYLTDYDDDEAT